MTTPDAPRPHGPEGDREEIAELLARIREPDVAGALRALDDADLNLLLDHLGAPAPTDVEGSQP